MRSTAQNLADTSLFIEMKHGLRLTGSRLHRASIYSILFM